MKNAGIKIISIALPILLLGGCAHESKVVPSSGHIDGQADAGQANQADAGASIPKPVLSKAYVPPPKPKTKEQTYSVVVNDVPVKEILFALARESKLNIDIHPTIQGRATLNAVDQTLPAILERLSKQVDLTYKFEGNVLSITPDQPVLRTYKVDYVNMSRDTKGFIGADGQISSTGQQIGGSSGGTVTSSGTGANNSSRTAVSSESKNHFWDSLVQNIKDLLAETDKEVIVSRIGAASQSGSEKNTEKGSEAGAASQAEVTKKADEDREKQKSEYKTLFAATVIANPETGVISVRGTSKQHAKVQEFLDKVMSSARRQVLIEATIVEVRLNDSYQAGIDWSRFGNTATSSGFTFQQTLGPSINAAATGFAVGYINPVSSLGNIAASVKLLQQFGDTKVLSSPKLMVLNNQTAVLKVVDNLVYFTIQVQSNLVTNAGSSNTVTTVPNTVPVGIVMSVTPQISESGMVNVNVRPTITKQIGYETDPNPELKKVNVESRIPIIQIREMESLLQIASGNTAVLGGLIQDEIQRNSDNVPGISRLPLIGKAFTGKDDFNKKTELVIFLRPTVVPNASLESDELQSFRQFLPSQQLQQKAIDESVN